MKSCEKQKIFYRSVFRLKNSDRRQSQAGHDFKDVCSRKRFPIIIAIPERDLFRASLIQSSSLLGLDIVRPISLCTYLIIFNKMYTMMGMDKTMTRMRNVLRKVISPIPVTLCISNKRSLIKPYSNMYQIPIVSI